VADQFQEDIFLAGKSSALVLEASHNEWVNSSEGRLSASCANTALD